MRPAIFFHPIMFLIAGMLLYACGNSQERVIRSPNIIVIMSDDQGWGDLSMNGNKNLHTPNIDLLAEKGVRFDRFYVSPVCSPTRAELLTGRYHPRSGVYSTSEGGERMNLDETTMADIFKAAGYSTAAFGKWHNGMQYPYHPNARGFDEFYGFCSGHWGTYFDPPLEHNGKLVKGEGYIINDLTEKAMGFIEQNQNSPFFLYVPYNTPHSPMQVPDIWWDKFKDKELEMFAENKQEEDITFTKAALAMCENIDWNVGRIMEKLKELNLEEETIVLYLSDNGPNSWRWNGGMKGRKGSTDEGGVRSPLIIRWTGTIPPGSNIKEIAGAIDLLPTLADLAGIEYQPKKPMDGHSLKPLLLENNPTWEDRLLFSHWGGRTSVRSQQHRLDHQGQLFDMTADPGQSTDLSGTEPGVARQLATAVDEWEADVLSEISNDQRRFPVGHPDFRYTQLPARDAKAHGSIIRSNKFPNNTFFTHWTSVDDKITWDVEVLSEGDYEVEIYYTCPPKDVGATFQLSFGSHNLTAKISEAHDPPLMGMENDRVERMESYVKDFKPLKMGAIHLEKGTGELTLQAIVIPGSQVMDFRLLMLTTVE
jgi:arylsulfatase A-like enzyme